MNNVFKFELNRNYKSLIGWLIGGILFSLTYSFMYPVFENDVADFTSVLSSYPDSVLAIIGINNLAELLSSFEHFYAFVINFLSLICFTFASVLTIKILGSEFENNSVQFIFTKPISRTQIFIWKIISIVVLITGFFIILATTNYLIASTFTDVNLEKFISINIPQLFIMYVASAISVLVVTVTKKIKSPAGLGFLIAFSFYFINVIAAIVESNELNYISIYRIFDLQDILMNSYAINDYIITTILYIILIIIGFVLYRRRDV